MLTVMFEDEDAYLLAFDSVVDGEREASERPGSEVSLDHGSETG
jgi:hypothetical protein